MRQELTKVIVVAVALAVGACSSKPADRAKDEAPDGGVTISKASVSMSDDSLALGDVRIVASNGGVDLALIGDSISTGLSPAALKKVRQETDTSKVTGTGYGASIEKMVKGTVQGAIGTRVSFPVSAVRSARYDGEKIVFDWNGEPRKIFDNAKVDGKPLLASFAAEDARRFVDAVNGRLKPKNL
ncbi:MAG TPA: hypothetical protein VJT85_01060 [Gemmatimonadaceae bacterium]|nr:hypothetical protein [Gemmatimonadaceae bacterium]